EGPQTGPVILYFHGISSPYRASIPLEYPLIDAGYRIVMPNRPGYEGTDDAYDCSAGGIAEMAREFLALLKIKGPVLVMGVSAGGPAALAFASAHATLTKALVLHSAVTHTWSETKYVPVYLQDVLDKAEILGLGKAFFGASAEVNAF